METYDSVPSGMAAMGTGILIFYLVILVLMIASMWKIFIKAGKPGWAAIIPIYNFIVLLEIVGKPNWWILLLIIPFVNFIILIIITHRLSISFGQGVGTTILLIILPFIGYPMLGFGSASYSGPPPA
jgi:hypothetical protein